jgi:hypothetical protein
MSYIYSEGKKEKKSKYMKKWWAEHPDTLRGKNSPWYGRRHTLETKEKMSASQRKWYKDHEYLQKGKGKNNPMYGKESRMKGKHHSEETRKIISKKVKEFYKNHPDEHKGKNSYWYGKRGILSPLYRRPKSLETRKKMSEGRLRYFREHPDAYKGKNHPQYGKRGILSPRYGKHGKPHSEEAKKKMRQKRLEYIKNHPDYLKGENHPMYGKHHTDEWKKMVSKKIKKLYSEGKMINPFPKGIKRPEFSGKNSYWYGKRGILSPQYGKHHTKESKEKMRKYRIKYFKTHPPTRPKPFFVKELGHGVRSTWEKDVGLLMKNNGIEYGYETKRFDLGDCTYLPDFEINEKLYVEVKGKLVEKNVKKLLKFQRLYPNITLIGIGDGDNKIFDIHLKWCDREKVVDIIKERCS